MKPADQDPHCFYPPYDYNKVHIDYEVAFPETLSIDMLDIYAVSKIYDLYQHNS